MQFKAFLMNYMYAYLHNSFDLRILKKKKIGARVETALQWSVNHAPYVNIWYGRQLSQM